MPSPANEPRVPYLDCAATTKVDDRVAEMVLHYMTVEYGNAGSRTHEYGSRARDAVETARTQVAAVVNADPSEVTFTSGATEINNLALLGLEAYGRGTGRMHIVSTEIEHKAVLEPLEVLARRGFDVDLVPPTAGGWVAPESVAAVLRPDTLLVSVMHVNNETGIIQPIGEIARLLDDHDAHLHVDAAQGFGKVLEPLKVGDLTVSRRRQRPTRYAQSVSGGSVTTHRSRSLRDTSPSSTPVAGSTTGSAGR